MKKVWILLSLIVFLASCEVAPQEIHYGADGCSFCKMTIVDSKHAAQIVTTKGKAFNYDAIECMVNHLKAWDQAPIELYLVVDYASPKILIDAQQAHYLISENIPSPMGANLSAFENADDLQQHLSHGTTKTLGWNQLLDELRNQ
ncbi:nitrous oxide reductase accessory protein NosL [Roseivirga sp. E12]|uniref:nitrous oxide reductase accessory protein NosL n=1 Tax=Roseivirga sp. E12 TaxID=2819237 RepID=UPI001ABC0620|nr:nitrous oxide reductase accessory protein NosL [Roseivirga sp. E12]MBO3699556.1 nitrous oxide reductase accessory protein NosL [Roseivirga sp. E12]